MASSMSVSDIRSSDPSQVAVKLTGVTKAFPLQGTGGRSLRLPWMRNREPQEVFHALKEISLEIPTGRSLGILGLNGAGKSTLLNIIAGNLRATSGEVEVNGHVQLLQLSGGFTLELSARQNVIAHARARGVPTEEIDRRLAYVEEFADIGPFFDQPMQTYSSGMRGRVAFGNAFAVDPEVLIVDEALAVGDALFANKCFRKIDDVRSKGTTILFTSHSSDAIIRLCDDGIVLHKGELIASGSAREAAKTYSSIVLGRLGDTSESVVMDNATAVPADSTDDAAEPAQDDEVRLEDFRFSETDASDRLPNCKFYNPHETLFGIGGARIVDCQAYVDGKPATGNLIDQRAKLDFLIRVYFDRHVEQPNFGFTVNTEEGMVFFGHNQSWMKRDLVPGAANSSRVYRLTFSADLRGGDWFIAPAIADGMTVLQERHSSLTFRVTDPEASYIGVGWLPADIVCDPGQH